MPDRNYTDITFVLDRSGSMASVADDTVGGFETFVKDHQAVQGIVKMTLVKFDHEYLVDYTGVPVTNVPRLNFQPRGNTALLDAIGQAIVETEERIAQMPQSERPDKVVFVILTDGYENASHEYTRPMINDLITQQQEQHNWQFMYLGANQDAITVGAKMGFRKGQTMSYASSGQGVNTAFLTASANTVAYAEAATEDAQLPDFTEEQRKENDPDNPKNKE